MTTTTRQITPFVHRSDARGHVNMGWLEARHSFSFGSWHDPRYMGVSALRVINEDRVAANKGFGKHGHDNMEILTYILSGKLSHQDSMGNVEHITAGEWQLMSAGSGVQHSEMNLTDAPVHLLQIWLLPNVQDAEPTYQQIRLDPKDTPNIWQWIVSPITQTNRTTPLSIRQDADIRAAWVTQGTALALNTTRPTSYLHVITGSVQVGELTVNTGDAIIFSESTTLIAQADSHVLWFELP